MVEFVLADRDSSRPLHERVDHVGYARRRWPGGMAHDEDDIVGIPLPQVTQCVGVEDLWCDREFFRKWPGRALCPQSVARVDGSDSSVLEEEGQGFCASLPSFDRGMSRSCRLASFAGSFSLLACRMRMTARCAGAGAARVRISRKADRMDPVRFLITDSHGKPGNVGRSY